MAYFKIEEFTKSTTADLYKVKNVPNETQKAHIYTLMAFLEKVREKWGKPIIINSGFRSDRLNTLVGGSKTSAHLKGYAADLKYQEGLFEFLVDYLKDKDFDELILEYSGSVKWIHISVEPRNRKQILVYKNGKYSVYKA